MLLFAGSIFETGKRWRVPYLLYLLAAIMVAEIAFNGDCLACAAWGTLWNDPILD